MKNKLHLLDFDLENRPLSYRGYDKTSAEITGIAAQFLGQPKMYLWLLDRNEDNHIQMFNGFRRLYDRADIVIGHNIRGHDLPLLNGTMVEWGLPSLTSKQTLDTYNDLIKHKDLSFKQEDLAAMLKIPLPKVYVSNTEWRIANRLSRAGKKITSARVRGDVLQNIAMYYKLCELNYLKGPKLWKP